MYKRQVVVGAGPWVRDFWNMLELPKTTEIKGKDGKKHEVEMWKYWFLQEGVLGVEADYLRTNEGKQPPVIHVDTDAPLHSDATGKLITDELWGIYYKPDIEGLGVQGGTSPYIVEKHFDKVNVDPYGIDSPEYQTTDKFADMWTYWFLQEGVLGVDADYLRTNEGKQPPVIHVDTDAPLYSDKDKKLITDKLWGIYYKPDIEGLGVQGGTSPYIVQKHFDKVNVDPYGLESPEYQTTDEFADMWSSALAHCQKRFEGKSNLYRKGPSGGLGCLTPDSFPIFDRFLENVYMIADANHGYKMLGVGHLVAQEILGQESTLLKPFRFNRYAKGELHPTSNSPFPWS